LHLLNVLKSRADACPGSTQQLPIEPGQIVSTGYLRAAQAYMLISMPTGTSTILGVFQAISFSQLVWRELHAGAEAKSTFDVTQVLWIEL
jgi:hypothetical protein